MEIIYFLLPLSLILALIGLAGFIWNVRSKQYDDIESASMRVLFDDDSVHKQLQQEAPSALKGDTTK